MIVGKAGLDVTRTTRPLAGIAFDFISPMLGYGFTKTLPIMCGI